MTARDDLVRLDAIPGEFAAHGWRNVLIASWPQTTKLAGVERLMRVRGHFLEDHPEGISLVHIALQPGVPDEDTQTAMVEMMKAQSEGLGCIAVVMAATGFEASRIRSAVTSMRMIEAPGSFKMRFHTDVRQVLDWLPEEHERKTGVHLERSLLLSRLRKTSDLEYLAGTR